MKVGINLPQIGQQATKDNVLHIAREAEKEGLDSVWTFDRMLWPLNPQTPHRGTSDGRLSADMQNVFDPIGLLTFVAANTNKIASVIDMLFHTPYYHFNFFHGSEENIDIVSLRSHIETFEDMQES